MAVTVVAFMVAAGAPSTSLSFEAIGDVWDRVGWPGAFAVVIISLAISITLQPLQFRLVQLLEGYWPWRIVDWLTRVGTSRQRHHMRRQQKRLTASADAEPSVADLVRMTTAEENLRVRFPRSDRLLPTSLGNVLRAAEDRSGIRWHCESVTIWPRLFPLLPTEHTQAIEDEVLQLDLSARLSVTWAVAAATASGFLLLDLSELAGNPEWALLVGALALMSWLSYRGAVESALAHGRDIEITLDLYKGRVLDALRFPEPTNLRDERRLLTLSTELLQSYDPDADWHIEYRSR